MKMKHGYLLVAGLFLFALIESCKKSSPVIQVTTPLVANAGSDVNITILGLDSAVLDGSGSGQPGVSITSFLWTKVSGPAQGTIVSPESAKTVVKNLAQNSVYKFELKVTDNQGRTARDTVTVNVNFGLLQKPLQSNAGVDVQVFLPDNAYLDGSLSTSNNVATVFTWTKVSGPASFSISNDHNPQAIVSNLELGVYQFELLVEENTGLTSRDTVTITVKPARPVISLQMIPFKTLGSTSNKIYSAMAGNKIIFAEDGTHIDIYDLGTQTWSDASLSQARYGGMAVVTLGTKVFFAGGNTSATDYVPTSRVDIFDSNLGSWTTRDLSRARGDLTATAVNDKVFFAGGYNPYDTSYSTIDIFDSTANLWTTALLSEARYGPAAATVGNRALFAGGFFSRAVDIFDDEGGGWKVDSLVQARGKLSAVSLNGKAYFAGGETGSSLSSIVDIYDNASQSWSVDYLSRPKSSFSSATLGNRILFFANAGTRVDIYDEPSNSWSTAELNQPLYGATVISDGSEIYAAASNMVWKLVF